MTTDLKCFISASHDTDLDPIKRLLSETGVEVFDLYDFSVGESFYQILRRKLREADFALFVLSSDNSNILYEMGVCDGLGKKYFVLSSKGIKLPLYLESQIFIGHNSDDEQALKLFIYAAIKEVTENTAKPKSSVRSSKKRSYSSDVRDNLESFLPRFQSLRETGNGRGFEELVGELFRSLRLEHSANTTSEDTGIDFAIWSDGLGKILGNPVFVEVKYGSLTQHKMRETEERVAKYMSRSQAGVALVLYLDKTGKRFELNKRLAPLILTLDAEDFIKLLIESSFDTVILEYRNKIAHGIY